jgi:hypothetical protein
MAKSSAFVVAPVSGSQRARSFKGPPQSSLSFGVTAGDPLASRNPLFHPRGICLFERIRRERVISHAPKQTDYRPNENAAYRARLDHDDTNGRKGDGSATARAKADKD